MVVVLVLSTQCLLALRVDLVWDGGEKRGGARVRRDAVRAARSVRRF